MEMDFDLEEIILYLNANEPTGKYCKNIENLKNKLLKAQEQEKVLEIIKKHFNIRLLVEETKDDGVWGRLVMIQSKQDEGTWDTTATANVVDYKEEFELLKAYFEKNIQK
jgi:hypothetical protein